MPTTRAVRISLWVAGVLAAALLSTYVYLRSRGNDLLQARAQDWLAHRIAVLSDSVYDVRLHRLRYDPAARSLRFDSLVVATRVVRNQALAAPLPTLTLTVYRGRMTGIELWEAVSGRRIRATELGFDSVAAIVVLPSLFRDTTAAPPGAAPDTAAAPTPAPASATSLVVIGGEPAGLAATALASVKRVRFENVRGRLVVPLEDGMQEFELRNLGVRIDGVSFDARKDAMTPFHARDVRLEARAFEGDVGPRNHLAFASLEGSWADSVLHVEGLRFEPRGGDAGYLEGRKYRGTRAQLGFRSLHAAGVDWNGLLRSSGVRVRRVALDSFELDLLADKRLPANPVRQPRPYLQQRIARLRTLMTVDSVLLADARVQYAERPADGGRPGRLRFEAINGSIANFSNDPVRQTDSTPLRLAAKARLMGAGALDVLIELPLLADGLDGRYRVGMGPMDAAHLNEMVTPLTGAKITEGRFTSLLLEAHVRHGRYDGRFVPEFRDLGVAFPQTAKQKREEKGVGGFFKGLGRGLKKLAANTVVRNNNPSKPGEPPHTGHVTHVRQPWETFWAGIWQSLKPALKESVVNVDL